MQSSRIAEFTLNGLTTASKGRIKGAFQRKVLSYIRRILARNKNSYVRYQLGGREILVPLAHDLPLIRSVFPQYSTNIARLCGYLSEKFQDLHIIDIGANIGDTVAIIRERNNCPILCVEADEYYFQILSENLRRANLQPVEAVHAFVATYTGELTGQLSSAAGTAHFVDNKTTVLNAVKLSHLLEKYPQFKTPKLLKIDTDGFDCSILRSELELLAEKRPVVFFEYDPFFFSSQPYDGTLIFKDMCDIGYTFAIFYDNVGDYLTSVDLQKDGETLADLQNYFVGRGGHQYLDVAVFHEDDRELAEHIRVKEADWSLRWRIERSGVSARSSK